MMMTPSSLSTRVLVAGIMLMMVAFLCKATQLDQVIKDSEIEHARSSNSNNGGGYISIPSSFARFLFYRTRPVEGRQLGAGALGYKRSSSALDALTGVTLGKRSSSLPPTVELLQMDPLFGRLSGIRSAPRVYDWRFGPSLDSYDMPTIVNNEN